jgi:hypothetical protein
LVLWRRPASILLRYDDCQHRVPTHGAFESNVVSIRIAQNRITALIDQLKVCDSCHRLDSANDVTGGMAELYTRWFYGVTLVRMSQTEWSSWRPFPDPRKSESLTAPIGAGCYELRHRDGRFILFGTSKNVVYRMTSLLPKPWGAGGRSNADKRAYVFKHLADIEYRTSAFTTSQEAIVCERELKSNNTYIFTT